MPLLKLAEHYFYILSRFFRVDSFFRPFRFALCHSSLYQKVKFIVLGWNSINLGILCYLFVRQRGRNANEWFREMRRVFGLGAVVYTIWGVSVILFVPWLMRYGLFQIVQEMVRPR
ncbi:hypothetical protein KFU94_69060 [Chloroflexi bacterium TSY]|nr:hypothetical protein [Chloroflexi bacterium TSY]